MQTTDDILFSAHGPDPIPSATTEVVGTPGNALNVYWIVSHFPIGSVVSGPFPQKDSPNVLDDENYVHISWLPTLGASSYDLLFTWELQLPRQPGRFLLAANLTSTEFRDTGQDLDLYDLAGIRYGAPQQEWIYFDNRDRKQPTLRFIPWPIEVSSIIFEDGTSLSTAGAAGGAAPPDQSVQFNNNGAFGGSSNLLWDGNNLLVGPQNVQNFPTPSPSDRVLSVQGSSGPGTVELSTGDGDAANQILGNFLWIDKNRIAPSNNAGVIRVLTTGPTPNNRGTRMEFFTRIDGSIDVPLPGPHMVIDQGLVGIGTNNPQFTLDVNGIFHVIDPSAPSFAGVFISTQTNGNGFISGGPFPNFVRLSLDGNPLVLNSIGTGLVGVGLVNPKYQLDVQSPSGTGTININGSSGGTGGGGFNDPVGFFSFSNVQSAATDQRVAQLFVGTDSTGPDSGVIIFQTAAAGVLGERMRITSQGNVGINTGTQTPQAPLDIAVLGLGHLLVQPTESSIGTVMAIFSVDPANTGFSPLSIWTNGLILPGLPAGSPGVGSKQLYYDPADGNIVKYAP